MNTTAHHRRCTPVRAATDPAQAVLGRLLWQWLAVGALAWLLFPALRGSSPWLGEGALWLLGLPASALLVFHRDRWARARVRGPRGR